MARVTTVLVAAGNPGAAASSARASYDPVRVKVVLRVVQPSGATPFVTVFHVTEPAGLT